MVATTAQTRFAALVISGITCNMDRERSRSPRRVMQVEAFQPRLLDEVAYTAMVELLEEEVARLRNRTRQLQEMIEWLRTRAASEIHSPPRGPRPPQRD